MALPKHWQPNMTMLDSQKYVAWGQSAFGHLFFESLNFPPPFSLENFSNLHTNKNFVCWRYLSLKFGRRCI